MPKRLYDVRVYKVTETAEITILADNQGEAEYEALTDRKKLHFVANGRFLAIGQET